MTNSERSKRELERIMSRTRRDAEGCLVWTGALNNSGYGSFSLGPRHSRRWIMVHRYLYERMVGPIPSGRDLDHFVCSKRECVDWTHVRPVTRRENNLRGNGIAAIHASRTHCPRGHEYDEANTIVEADGSRGCRTCTYERNRARKAQARTRYLRSIEDVIGRPLRDDEIAVHRDGNKANIARDNIEIITRAEMLRRRLNRHRDPVTGRAA